MQQTSTKWNIIFNNDTGRFVRRLCILITWRNSGIQSRIVTILNVVSFDRNSFYPIQSFIFCMSRIQNPLNLILESDFICSSMCACFFYSMPCFSSPLRFITINANACICVCQQRSNIQIHIHTIFSFLLITFEWFSQFFRPPKKCEVKRSHANIYHSLQQEKRKEKSKIHNYLTV